MKINISKKTIYASVGIVIVIMIVVLTLLFVNRSFPQNSEIVRFAKKDILSTTVIDDKREVAEIQAFFNKLEFQNIGDLDSEIQEKSHSNTQNYVLWIDNPIEDKRIVSYDIIKEDNDYLVCNQPEHKCAHTNREETKFLSRILNREGQS